MALQGSGQISFSQIENEFGQNGERSLGDYRTSQSVGELSNLPLDSGIPTSGQIKFSDFYSKRLNIVVDMHSGGDEFRKSAKNDKWNNNNLTVIGGFRSKKEDGSKIIVHVNKKFGSDKSSVNNCAVRTGSWNSTSSIIVDVGGEGQILGAGGDGGQGGVCLGTGSPGGTGTSGLGIDHNGVTVNVLSGGIIRAGFGGGGGGGGVAKLTKVQTEELLVVEAVVVLDSLQVMEVNLVMVVRMVVLVRQVMKLLLEMVVAVVIMETKHTVLLVEKVVNLERQQIMEVVLKQVVDLVEETEQQLEVFQDLVLQ